MSGTFLSDNESEKNKMKEFAKTISKEGFLKPKEFPSL
jgi:hypothetical protein